jgi:hypothetical protein
MAVPRSAVTACAAMNRTARFEGRLCDVNIFLLPP